MAKLRFIFRENRKIFLEIQRNFGLTTSLSTETQPDSESMMATAPPPLKFPDFFVIFSDCFSTFTH